MITSAYTEETFLQQLDSLYPDRDYQIISPYIRGDLRMLIKNKYGVCSVIAKTLFAGTIGSIRVAVDKTSYRINMFKEVHNNLYEYPEYQYGESSVHITILCKEHGLQTVVESNHMKGFGCKDCVKRGAPAMTEDEFCKRMGELRTDVEVLEEYKGYHTHLLCKNKYGFIEMPPQGLLKGFTGSLKLAVDKTAYMIEQFKEKHNNKYSYQNYKYCGNRCIGIITCPIHGDFPQMTDVHLMGSGCTGCSYLDSERINGYSRSGFTYKAKGRECILYIVRMCNTEEDFYKIGITSHPTKKRFSKACDVKYKIDVIFEYKSFNAGYIWDLEKEHHRRYRLFHYKPKIYFKGITECFNLSLPIQEIMNSLKP